MFLTNRRIDIYYTLEYNTLEYNTKVDAPSAAKVFRMQPDGKPRHTNKPVNGETNPCSSIANKN